jgi:hypothetical protein
VPGVEAGAHRGALRLDREIDEGGRAAVRGRDGARLEIVGGRGAAEGHIEVGVRVDAARHDVFARGINDAIDLVGARDLLRRVGEGDDDALLDPDVGGEGVDRGHDGAVLYQRSHALSLQGGHIDSQHHCDIRSA